MVADWSTKRSGIGHKMIGNAPKTDFDGRRNGRGRSTNCRERDCGGWRMVRKRPGCGLKWLGNCKKCPEMVKKWSEIVSDWFEMVRK